MCVAQHFQRGSDMFGETSGETKMIGQNLRKSYGDWTKLQDCV